MMLKDVDRFLRITRTDFKQIKKDIMSVPKKERITNPKILKIKDQLTHDLGFISTLSTMTSQYKTISLEINTLKNDIWFHIGLCVNENL